MTLSPRPALALLAAAGAVVFMGTRLLPPAMVALRTGRARQEASLRLVAESRRAIASLPALEDSARELRARIVHLAPRLLVGNSAPEALADLQGRLQLLAVRNRVDIGGFTPLTDTVRAGALREVRATTTLVCDTQGLADLLTDLVRVALIIVPERLSVTSGGEDAARDLLQVELTLAAWYLPERPAP